MAFIAVAYTDLGWLAALLGIAVTVLLVVWVDLVLDFLETRRRAGERDLRRGDGP